MARGCYWPSSTPLSSPREESSRQDAEELPCDHGVPLQVLQGLVDVHLPPQHLQDGGVDECLPCAKFIEI